jgi:hypothetical protein
MAPKMTRSCVRIDFLGHRSMHSMLSLLFSSVLAALIYGLSHLPSASLSDPDDAEELALTQKTEALSHGSQVRRGDDG